MLLGFMRLPYQATGSSVVTLRLSTMCRRNPPPVQQIPQAVPAPPAQTQPAPAVDEWFRTSASSGVSGFSPPDFHAFTTGQLEIAPQLRFSWKGTSSEYRFALFRANGQAIIQPVTVTASLYVFPNPSSLPPGEYVWQIFESDGQGNWDLPSVSNRFAIERGTVEIRNLETQDPGVLYGNQ